MAKTLRGWLDEYSDDHRHPTNQAIHKVCVPAIAVSLLTLLWAIPWRVGGPSYAAQLFGNAAGVLIVAATVFYLSMSVVVALVMLAITVPALAGVVWLATDLGVNVAAWAAGIFIVAWIGQFFGHHAEGRRPAFFRDLQFLLVGPVWTLRPLWRRLGLLP